MCSMVLGILPYGAHMTAGCTLTTSKSYLLCMQQLSKIFDTPLLSSEDVTRNTPRGARSVNKGGFAVQKPEGRKFSKVAVDHCIEQTFNRHTKTRVGFIAFSHKKRTEEKWIPTAHARAALTNECCYLAGLKVESAVTNTDTQISKIKRERREWFRISGWEISGVLLISMVYLRNTEKIPVKHCLVCTHLHDEIV